MAEPKIKYDRQLRIWGEQGQAALEKASICLLNCGPTGSETLKNLVLGGVGSITVVDGSKVEVGDLGNNFMVDELCIGESKAKCVCSFLQELNDAVKAKFIEEYPQALIETNPSFFSQFTLVVATQLVEDSMMKLDRICREANVMLIFARSYGLTGLVRISVKEHTIIESKPDHFLDDLRLNNPWPELKRFAEGIDLTTADPVAHKHIPYAVILVKMANEWAGSHNGRLPSTREEKKEFKELLKSRMIAFDEDNYKEAIEASFKVFAPRGISQELKQIIDDSAAELHHNSSDFWVMVAALKEFIANEGAGEAPLEGSIPDMTSSTEHYVNLQKIYQAKAEADFLVMEQRVRSHLKKIGREINVISKQTIRSFCRNARKLKVCRYHLVEDEFNSPVLSELQKYLADEEYSVAVGFYILLRAVDRFAANYNSFPGEFDGEMDEDISRLKTTAVGLLSDLGCNGQTLTEDLISEMCRFGAAELHAVAAFIGGVASQEVIKLITKQFVPMSGTFIFNGIDQRSSLLEKSTANVLWGNSLPRWRSISFVGKPVRDYLREGVREDSLVSLELMASKDVLYSTKMNYSDEEKCQIDIRSTPLKLRCRSNGRNCLDSGQFVSWYEEDVGPSEEIFSLSLLQETKTEGAMVTMRITKYTDAPGPIKSTE